jgi:hypothetical protein
VLVTLSKALEKSQNKKQLNSFFSSELSIELYSSNNWWSEIVDFIQILDLKKASGPDKISHKMLKIAPEKIAEPLQIIFNNAKLYRKLWKSHRIKNN